LPFGGEREVSIIASALSASQNQESISSLMVYNRKQCDNVFIEGAAEEVRRTTLYFRWVAGQRTTLQNGIGKPVMQVSIQHSWAYLSRGVWTEKCTVRGLCSGDLAVYVR
jgi:hypothetical protein